MGTELGNLAILNRFAKVQLDVTSIKTDLVNRPCLAAAIFFLFSGHHREDEQNMANLEIWLSGAKMHVIYGTYTGGKKKKQKKTLLPTFIYF